MTFPPLQFICVWTVADVGKLATAGELFAASDPGGSGLIRPL